MIWVTWFSARVAQLSVFSVSSSVVHSLNRYITSLSDGATQFSPPVPRSVSPCASGVRTNVRRTATRVGAVAVRALQRLRAVVRRHRGVGEERRAALDGALRRSRRSPGPAGSARAASTAAARRRRWSRTRAPSAARAREVRVLHDVVVVERRLVRRRLLGGLAPDRQHLRADDHDDRDHRRDVDEDQEGAEGHSGLFGAPDGAVDVVGVRRTAALRRPGWWCRCRSAGR